MGRPVNRTVSTSPRGAAAHRRRLRLAAAGAALAGLLGLALGVARPLDAAADPPASRPNVVMLMTDDQTLAEMSALPYTSALMAGGVNFSCLHLLSPVLPLQG
jgi:hypothetical protein